MVFEEISFIKSLFWRNYGREKILALNNPNQAVSTQTFSNWVVQTIRMAYDDTNLEVKAHSTRAIGPSYAHLNGASMNYVLEVAA